MDGSAPVTNSFTNVIGSVSFATNVVFVDMRIKFDPLTDTLTTDTLAQAKMALFANANSNLVAAVSGGVWSTNLTLLDLSKWYQVTVVMKSNKFDVLTNDVIAFSNLSINNATASNVLTSMSISGPASLDDLYVSLGNPAYPGTLGAVPPGVTAFPGTGGGAVTNWLANFFNDGRIAANANFSAATSSAQLDAAYLLNEPLGGTASAPTPPVYAFGIASIDLLSATSVRVTAKLTTGASPTPKVGAINGKIVLRSSPATNGTWTVSSAQSPAFDSNGKAAITFTVPSGDRFFDARIVDPTTP